MNIYKIVVSTWPYNEVVNFQISRRQMTGGPQLVWGLHAKASFSPNKDSGPHPRAAQLTCYFSVSQS